MKYQIISFLVMSTLLLVSCGEQHKAGYLPEAKLSGHQSSSSDTSQNESVVDPREKVQELTFIIDGLAQIQGLATNLSSAEKKQIAPRSFKACIAEVFIGGDLHGVRVELKKQEELAYGRKLFKVKIPHGHYSRIVFFMNDNCSQSNGVLREQKAASVKNAFGHFTTRQEKLAMVFVGDIEVDESLDKVTLQLNKILDVLMSFDGGKRSTEPTRQDNLAKIIEKIGGEIL